MRVMFWSAVHWPHIGGVQELANNLLPALQERGHRFVVVCEQDPPDLPAHEEHHGVRIVRFPLSRGLQDIDQLAWIRSQIQKLKREFSPELHHTVALGATDFYYRITAHIQPAPRLVSVFGRWPPMYDPLLRSILSTADWVVCDSDHSRKYANRLLPDTASRSSVLRNAIRIPPEEPAPLPWQPPTLLFLGRLSREKGVDLVLTALSLLKEDHPDAQLIVAGDGSERERLAQQTHDLALSGSVRFKGWVPQEEIPALLNEATLLVLPSRSDSFPLAGLQAALMQRPVVATHVGGIPELILNRQTGLLVERENPSALAGAISSLLNDPAGAASLGEAARKRALTEFRFDRLVDSYEKLYRKVATEDNRLVRSVTGS